MKTNPTQILSIDATRARLGLGRTKVRELVKSNDLEAVKVGRRTMVVEASIEQFIGRLPRVC